MNPKISIIVPVYNVGKYLEQSLDSILAQSFESWEAIVVDDGSTDGSGAICDRYASIDSRFVVIHQPNQGVSEARNNGIRVAKGDYVAFLDSDDWLAPEFMGKMYSAIVVNDCDMAQCGWYEEFVNLTRVRGVVKSRVCDKYELVRLLVNGNRLPSFLCNKLFARNVISPDIPPGRRFEDIQVLSRWYTCVRRFCFVDGAFYHYRQRLGSATYTANSDDYFWANYQQFKIIRGYIKRLFQNPERDVLINSLGVKVAKKIARYKGKASHKSIFMIKISAKLPLLPQDSDLRPQRRWRIKMLKYFPGLFCRMLYMNNYLKFASHKRDPNLYR